MYYQKTFRFRAGKQNAKSAEIPKLWVHSSKSRKNVTTTGSTTHVEAYPNDRSTELGVQQSRNGSLVWVAVKELKLSYHNGYI